MRAGKVLLERMVKDLQERGYNVALYVDGVGFRLENKDGDQWLSGYYPTAKLMGTYLDGVYAGVRLATEKEQRG